MFKKEPNRLPLPNITPDGKRMFISLIILAVLLIATGIVMPSMISISRFSSITNGQLTVLLASLGQTLVLLIGGIDLSVGGVICIINSLAAVAMPESGLGIILFCLGCVAIGLAIGGFNGFIVTKFNVQPFIVTFTVNYILLGISQLILGRDGGAPAKAFTKVLMASFGPVSLGVILVVFIIVMWTLLRRTKFIRDVFAVGTNAKASAMNGINVVKVKLIAFAISGGCAALAGLWRTAQLGSGSPTAGNALTTPTLTIAVIGGTSMMGGIGGMYGTVVGAYILRIISDLLTFLGTKSFWSTVFQGIFLVATVVVCSVIDRKNRSK
ncbi:ABC transporter permease [Oscillibacter sp.]|uniref:ABC transporter permease n=1 Tax=Oscillibacter sp. TaxID=1945593 RepID=UPI00260B7884|nr:ABC transporter permease [Oscillibacter sp.]MDD3347639.1 ABC transporter permease [Oscillibacter sp.]